MTETVAFLFADLEGSTRLLSALESDAYSELLTAYWNAVEEAATEHGGEMVGREGDGLFVVLPTAAGAVRAAVSAQRALAEQRWPGGVEVAARMGVHVGEAQRHGDDDYVGLDIHRAARVGSAAHGGQILISEAVRVLAGDGLPEEVDLRDLGEHRLKGLERSERLHQVVTTDLPDAFPPLRTLEATPNNIPEQPTSFVGRRRELAEVIELVRANRLVTLVGVGGAGKTRLAVRTAAELLAEHPDGAWFVELAALTDPQAVVHQVVTALGVRADETEAGTRPAEARLIDHLTERELLVALDNCEHVLAPVGRLCDRVLRAAPGVRILATSREALGIAGELRWPVPSLGLSGEDAPEGQQDGDAIRLFVERARGVVPSFALTEETRPLIARICRRLDGIPLAIELAAARVRVLGLEQLVDRLDDRFRVLTGGSRTALPRQRTLVAAMDWSYELLGEPERRLFERLSVFAGRFTLEAVEQVCAGDGIEEIDVLDLLEHLVDKSLVDTVGGTSGPVRYRLLETLREYSAQRLEESGTSDRYRRAHAAHHLRSVEELGPRIRSADERVAIAQIEAMLDDLRTAHEWLVATGDADGALRLAVALRDHISYGLRDEVVTWTERGLELSDAPTHPTYAAALATAAAGVINRGELDRGRQLAEDALSHGEPETLATLWALLALGDVALYEGRLEDVLAFADRGAELADRLGEDYYRALADQHRVLAHLYRGDAEAAATHAVDLREAAARSGSHSLQAAALYAHGEALLDTDPVTATELLERAIEEARHSENRLVEGVALVSLASLSGRRGETGRALELFREVVSHWRRLGDYTHQLTTLRNLVELLTRVGADEPAASLHGAVTAADAPSFGAEAERLAAAWTQLEQRLGADAATAAAERGRRMTASEMVDEALAQLDALLQPREPNDAVDESSGSRP